MNYAWKESKGVLCWRLPATSYRLLKIEKYFTLTGNQKLVTGNDLTLSVDAIADQAILSTLLSATCESALTIPNFSTAAWAAIWEASFLLKAFP